MTSERIRSAPLVRGLWILILLVTVSPIALAETTTLASMESPDDMNYVEGEPEIIDAGPDGGDVARFNESFEATLNPNTDLRDYDVIKVQMKAGRSAFAHLEVNNVPWEDKTGNWYFLDGLQPGFDWKTVWIDLDRPESGWRSSADDEDTTLRLSGEIKDTGRSMQDAKNIYIGDIRAVKKVVDVEWNQSQVSYTWDNDLTYTYPLRITNVHDTSINATISLDGYEAPHASATLSEDQVELQPDESTTVTATLTLPGDVAESAEQLYTERFKVTTKADGYPDSRVTVLRSANPIPLTVTVPPSEGELEFPFLPPPSDLPEDLLYWTRSEAEDQFNAAPTSQLIEDAKEHGLREYVGSSPGEQYSRTLIASAYLYNLTGDQKYLDKAKNLSKALPEVWDAFYQDYADREERLVSNGILSRWDGGPHFTLGLGWVLMGTQRSPYQYSRDTNAGAGSMSSVFYAFDMIAPYLEEGEREEIIDEFIVPAGIQSRNHLIGDGNQQATVNSVALYAGLAGENWPLAAFATSSDHSVHEVMDWTFTDEGVHIRDNYQTYALRPIMWAGELLYQIDTNLFNIQKSRLEKAADPAPVDSEYNDQEFWDFVQTDRFSAGNTVGTPDAMEATPTSQAKIRLEWIDVEHEARYLVERSTSPESGYEQIATTRRNTPVYEDECTPGTTYHYRVKAYNYNDEESSYSDVATATCGGGASCIVSPEVCDGEDNDCDGLIDEGCSVTNENPAVSFSSLSDDQLLDAPASLGVEANAMDSDGSVVNVTLAANGETVRSEDTAPYQWGDSHPSRGDEELENVSAGEYEYTLTAVDDDGASSTASVTVLIQGDTLNLSAYPELHDNVTFTASDMSVSDDLVFDTGYIYIDDVWESFSLSGNRVSDAWLAGSGNGSADFASAEYAAVYSCFENDGFDCRGGWQVANLTASDD